MTVPLAISLDERWVIMVRQQDARLRKLRYRDCRNKKWGSHAGSDNYTSCGQRQSTTKKGCTHDCANPETLYRSCAEDEKLRYLPV